MATKNKRVATYLPPAVYEKLQDFKTKRDVEGDSQALIIILSEFLGVSQKAADQGSSANLELGKRVNNLEDKITKIKEELLDELHRELLEHRSSSIERAKAEVKDELLSELKGELPKTTTVDGQLELIPEQSESNMFQSKEVPVDWLSERALAKKLGCSSASTISRWRKRGGNVLLEQTRAMNNGIGWVYDSEARKYHLETIIASDSPKAQESELLDVIEPEF